MKPKNKKPTFDASWFKLLPVHRRGDHRFWFRVASRVKQLGIKRNDLRAVGVVVKQTD